MKRNLVVVLDGVMGISVLIIIFVTRRTLHLSDLASLLLGLILGLAGLLLWVLAYLYLERYLTLQIEPKSNSLIQSGPYRLVRHPTYLGIIFSAAGLAVLTRSLAGLLSVFILLLPFTIWRAKMEERALKQKFGSAWTDYASRTGFFLPRIGKRC